MAAIRGNALLAAGVHLGNACFLEHRNRDLLAPLAPAERCLGERAAVAVDAINGHFGAGTIRFGENRPHPAFFERG